MSVPTKSDFNLKTEMTSWNVNTDELKEEQPMTGTRTSCLNCVCVLLYSWYLKIVANVTNMCVDCLVYEPQGYCTKCLALRIFYRDYMLAETL